MGRAWPVAESHRRTMPFQCPVARVCPSGLKATPKTQNALIVNRSFPVATSQSLAQLPQWPETIICPSGLKATLLTALRCPSKERISSPVAVLHSFTVSSSLAEAST